MMKRILTNIILTLVGINASAQLLWRVEETGTIIFGTHHLAPVTMIDSVGGLRQAIVSADIVIGEVDDRLMADPVTMAKLAELFMAPADSTLSVLLAPEQLDSLNTVFNLYTGGMMNAAAVDTMKPAVVATQLAMFAAMEVSGIPGDQLDMTIIQLARQHGAETDAFETPDQQMALLLSDPLPHQAKALMKSVADILDGSARKETEALYNAYMNQNLSAIEHVMLESDSMDDAEQGRLITDRNLRWVEKLTTESKAQTTLVVVGAGHLPGPNGLISLLRQKNLTVTPYGN